MKVVKRKKTKSSNGLLIIPRCDLSKIDGHARRRISVVITDPRSRHLVLTRYPENHKVWYQTTIEREMDFIPTAVLKKAKIHDNTNFSIRCVNGDLVVRRMK